MTDVVIAGAGIAGAVLALACARQGLSVTLVEQQKRFPHIYRGEFLQPQSLAILGALGLAPAITAVTTPVLQVNLRTAAGRLLGVVDYRALTGPIREGRNGHHREIQGAVLAALKQEPTVTLKMGTKVTGLIRRPEDGAVLGLQTSHGPLKGRLTVGAEGQHSTVRKELDLPTDAYRYPGEPLAVTIDLEQPPPPEVEFIFGSGRSALLFPLPGNRARLYLVVSDAYYQTMRDARDRGLHLLKSELAAFLPQYREAIHKIPSMGVVQRVPCWYLRAKRWVADGAAILGDAAHCVSPTRGQGMNLAIQDAAALAELVAALPRDRVLTEQELRPYQAVRQEPADFIQRDAGRVHRLLLAENPVAHLARNLWLGSIKRAPETMGAVLGMYAGTARPPRWYDHLFVSAAVMIPGMDRVVARAWGGRLAPVPSPVPPPQSRP